MTVRRAEGRGQTRITVLFSGDGLRNDARGELLRQNGNAGRRDMVAHQCLWRSISVLPLHRRDGVIGCGVLIWKKAVRMPVRVCDSLAQTMAAPRGKRRHRCRRRRGQRNQTNSPHLSQRRVMCGSSARSACAHPPAWGFGTRRRFHEGRRCVWATYHSKHGGTAEINSGESYRRRGIWLTQ